ncbi:ABC transporter ATP-binding protein [Sinorhizobium meliloti]|uniref:ABC transporter ATP-binding protein n=1 Tax=Rhizobium meliloti TaxID=382 RepID=UPI003D661585
MTMNVKPSKQAVLSERVDAKRGTAVSVRELDVRYGSVQVLQDVSLNISPGEMLVLLGASGSGKTTLLMSLAGFTQPHSGEILFDDQTVTKTPAYKRDIGIIFQNYALFPHMDVASNIAYPLRLRRLDRATIEKKVLSALDTVRLKGFGERRVDQLSGGQRQRVAVARALVFSPRILLLDEPLSALDKNLREEMQFELRRIHNETGATTVSVTHDQREALTMADRIAVMEGGQIVQIDTPKALYQHPNSRFVAEFIGDSNIIKANARGNEIITPLGRFAASGVAHGGEGWMIVRPEKLRIKLTEPAGSANTFSATVEETVYQGESLMVKLGAGNHQINVRVAATDPAFNLDMRKGERIAVSVDPSDIVVVAQ